MQVVIKEEVKQLQITTVTLSHDYDDPLGTKLYIFHCIRCGSPIIQYRGEIVSILPGVVPASLPLVLKCNNSRCRQRYMFCDMASVV